MGLIPTSRRCILGGAPSSGRSRKAMSGTRDSARDTPSSCVRLMEPGSRSEQYAELSTAYLRKRRERGESADPKPTLRNASGTPALLLNQAHLARAYGFPPAPPHLSSS